MNLYSLTVFLGALQLVSASHESPDKGSARLQKKNIIPKAAQIQWEGIKATLEIIRKAFSKNLKLDIFQADQFYGPFSELKDVAYCGLFQGLLTAGNSEEVDRAVEMERSRLFQLYEESNDKRNQFKQLSEALIGIEKGLAALDHADSTGKLILPSFLRSIHRIKLVLDYCKSIDTQKDVKDLPHPSTVFLKIYSYPENFIKHIELLLEEKKVLEVKRYLLKYHLDEVKEKTGTMALDSLLHVLERSASAEKQYFDFFKAKLSNDKKELKKQSQQQANDIEELKELFNKSIDSSLISQLSFEKDLKEEMGKLKERYLELKREINNRLIAAITFLGRFVEFINFDVLFSKRVALSLKQAQAIYDEIIEMAYEIIESEQAASLKAKHDKKLGEIRNHGNWDVFMNELLNLLKEIGPGDQQQWEKREAIIKAAKKKIDALTTSTGASIINPLPVKRQLEALKAARSVIRLANALIQGTCSDIIKAKSHVKCEYFHETARNTTGEDEDENERAEKQSERMLQVRNEVNMYSESCNQEKEFTVEQMKKRDLVVSHLIWAYSSQLSLFVDEKEKSKPDKNAVALNKYASDSFDLGQKIEECLKSNADDCVASLKKLKKEYSNLGKLFRSLPDSDLKSAISYLLYAQQTLWANVRSSKKTPDQKKIGQ